MSFEYHRQPLRLLFLTYSSLTGVFIHLPYWLFTSFLPSWRPRHSWSIKRTLTVQAVRLILVTYFKTGLPSAEGSEAAAAASADSTGFVWVEPTSELVVGEIRELAALNGVEAKRTSGYWYDRKGSDGKLSQKARPDEKVIYHLHGGGFVMGSANPKDMLSQNVCSSLIEHCSEISRVFAIEYRISSARPFTPSNAFPAALLDALAGYSYLISTIGFRPDNIIVSGDSAGGNLALALARHLVAINLTSVPLPGGLLLLSPAGEWLVTHNGPDSSAKRNARSDYCQSFFQGYSAKAILGNMPPDEAYTNPWISPASLMIADPRGQFAGFPRTCIVAGEAEFLVDSLHTLRDRFLADIGKERVTYIEIFGASHSFLSLVMQESERREALREIAAWVKMI